MKAKLTKLFTLLVVLLFGIGQMWGEDYVWNFSKHSTWTYSSSNKTVTLNSVQSLAADAEESDSPIVLTYQGSSTSDKIQASSHKFTVGTDEVTLTNQLWINGATSSSRVLSITGLSGKGTMTLLGTTGSNRYVGMGTESGNASSVAAAKDLGLFINNAKTEVTNISITTALSASTTYYINVSGGYAVYALIWTPLNTDGPFAITYDKNDEGASGTMTDASSPYTKDATVTVLANTFTAPTGKVFVGWNTKANGSGTSYDAGDTFDATEDVTLYAQWAYPATGTGTITYTLTSNANAVSPAVSGVRTLSSSSTAFTVSTLECKSGNSKDGYSGQITGHAADYSASQYVALQFTVADGYTFTPSAVSMKVFANSTSNMKMKLVFTDGVTSVESEELACASSADSDIEFASGAFTGKKFVGNVDVVLYQWGVASKRTYVKSPVTITGTVAAAVPVTNYTVTIDPNGGSYAETPDGWTYSAGVYTKSIASGTSFSAPAGLTKGTDDLTWKDGSDNPITFPVSITGDITFVAQWAPHAASSDATLSALSVAGCTLNETFDPATTAYTITLPFYASMPAVGDVTATKNDPNAEDPEVSISGNVITVHCVAEDGTAEKDYTITVTISPAPTASSSINIEQLILDNSKAYNIGAALDAAHIGYVSKDALDSLKSVAEKADRNEPYLGLKFKTSTSKVTIIVPDGEYLKVKFGYIDGSAGLKVSVNGSAAATPSLTSGVYTLAASAGVKEVVFTQTGSNKTVVYKQIKINEDIDAVTLPWLVTYTVGEHGTCAKAKETWKGSALTLPAVTPESGWNFDGWFTAASAGTKVGDAGGSYTPTADVELFAQYTALASPFDLTSLTYKIGTGAATNVGYVDGTFTYNIELPYAPSYDAITVSPVLKEATSSLKGDEVLTVSSLPGAATFTVVANDLSEKLYTINFSKNPKDGVCLVKIEPTSQTKGTQTGYYHDGDELTINLSSGMNLGGSGKYIGVKATENFQEGDILHLDLNTKPNTTGSVQIILYADKAAGTELWATGVEGSIADDYYLTLPAAVNGHKELYIVRTDGNKWNGGPTVMEVTRPMNPILTAITFAGEAGTINESLKTVTVTVPNATDLGSMTVVPTIVRNAPHATTPEAVITNAGAWVEGPNTYRIMDKDGDYTDYTVTITRAALSTDATLSSLTVNGQAVALADGVFDYSFELPYGTSSAPTVVATPHHVAAVATVNPCTLSGATITVVPESGAGDQKVYTLTFTISPWKEVVIWDGSTMSAVATSPDATGLAWEVNGFGSIANYAVSYAAKDYVKCLPSGGSASSTRNIELTVPAGYVAKFYVVGGSHSDDEERSAFIATSATKTDTHEGILTIVSPKRVDLAGGTSAVVGAGTYYLNPAASFDFYEIRAYLRPGYGRKVTNNIGTLCVDHNVAAEDLFGATFYQIAGKNAEGKLVFDEVTELEAGKPYIFQSTTGGITLYYGATSVANPIEYKGMVGSFSDKHVGIDDSNKTNIMYIASNKLWDCSDLTPAPGYLEVVANRAYIFDYEHIGAASPNPAPGRRRIIVGKDQATGFDQLETSETPMKLIIDGQLFILRGEKMYNANGQLVK